MAIDLSKYPSLSSERTVQSSGGIDLSKYPKVEGGLQTVPNEPKQSGGFLGDLARSVLSGVTRMGVSAIRDVQGIGDIMQGGTGKEIAAKPMNVPFMGEVKPIGQTGTLSQRVLDVVGTGADVASLAVGGGSVKMMAGETAKQFAARKSALMAKEVAKGNFVKKAGLKMGVESAVAGGLYGAGSEMQNPEATAGSIATGGAGGLLGGFAFGVPLGMVGGTIVSRSVKKTSDYAKFNLAKTIGDISQKNDKSQKILEIAKKKGTNPIKVLVEYGKETMPIKLEKGVVGESTVAPGKAFLEKKIGEFGKLQDELLDQVDFRQSKSKISDFHNYIVAKTSLLVRNAGDDEATNREIQKKVSDIITKKLAESGEDISFSEIRKLKSTIGKEVASFQTKGDISSKTDLKRAVYDAYDDFLINNIDGEAKKQFVNLKKTMASFYDASDLLDSYKGKPFGDANVIKAGMRMFVEGAGMSVGTTLGHPLLGWMGGRALGARVSSILSNSVLPNAMKAKELAKIQTIAPKAVTAIKEFLIKNNPTQEELWDLVTAKSEKEVLRLINIKKAAEKKAFIDSIPKKPQAPMKPTETIGNGVTSSAAKAKPVFNAEQIKDLKTKGFSDDMIKKIEEQERKKMGGAMAVSAPVALTGLSGVQGSNVEKEKQTPAFTERLNILTDYPKVPEEYREGVAFASIKTGIPVTLIAKQFFHESGYDPKKIGEKNKTDAKGNDVLDKNGKKIVIPSGDYGIAQLNKDYAEVDITTPLSKYDKTGGPFKKDWGHTFDRENPQDQILGYITYINLLKKRNPKATNDEIIKLYNKNKPDYLDLVNAVDLTK
jgi:hypothetical protein